MFKSMCVLRSFVIAISVIIGVESSVVADKSNLENNFLVFYDLKTNQTLLPPIVTSLTLTQSPRLPRPPRLPLFRRPCSCETLHCGCCAGMTIQQFNFNQHLCANFTYDPNEFSIQMDVMMNENSLYSNMVSARNPPPLCIPVPLPYIPLSTEMCVKMFNVFTQGRNIHMCMDMQMKVQKAPVIVLHFDCMRMGQSGVALVKPDQNGGFDVTDPPQVENPGIEETVPQSPLTSQPSSGSVEPPQTDYDIFDEVTEVKIKI